MRRVVFAAAALTLVTAMPGHAQSGAKPEAMSLSGKPLVPPATIPNKAKLDADLAQAEAELVARSDDPEALIWVGRRQAYLWRYNDAIETFSKRCE